MNSANLFEFIAVPFKPCRWCSWYPNQYSLCTKFKGQEIILKFWEKSVETQLFIMEFSVIPSEGGGAKLVELTHLVIA